MRLLFLLTALTACGEDTADDAVSPCAEETRADPLQAGDAFSGDSMTLTVDAADPEPARAGENIWEVSLASGGAPLEGCTFAAESDMPDHGHGGPAPDFVELGGGAYTVTVEFTMGGYWEVEIVATCGEEIDTIPVAVCAES